VIFVERFSDVSGLHVVCIDSEEKAGTVETIVCDDKDGVLGFLVNSGKLANKYGFIFIEDVIDVGKNEITIPDGKSILKKRSEVKDYRKNRGWAWLNKKVISEEGQLLGTIKDGAFDVNSGKISEVELSLGVMEDLRDGRRRFCIDRDTEFGEEFIILKTGGKNG